MRIQLLILKLGKKKIMKQKKQSGKSMQLLCKWVKAALRQKMQSENVGVYEWAQ